MSTSDTSVFHIGSDGQVSVEAGDAGLEREGHQGPIRVHMHANEVKRKVDTFLRELVRLRLNDTGVMETMKPAFERKIEVSLKNVMADVEREMRVEATRMARERLRKEIDSITLVVEVEGFTPKAKAAP